LGSSITCFCQVSNQIVHSIHWRKCAQKFMGDSLFSGFWSMFDVF